MKLTMLFEAGRKGVVSSGDWPEIVADYLRKKQANPSLSRMKFASDWGIPASSLATAIKKYSVQAQEILNRPAPPPITPTPIAPTPEPPVQAPQESIESPPATPAPSAPAKPVEVPLRGWTRPRRPNVLLVGGYVDDVPPWLPKFFNMYHADLDKFEHAHTQVLERHFGNKQLDLILVHSNLVDHQMSYGSHELANKLGIAVLSTRGGFASTVPTAQKLGLNWYVDAFIRGSRKIKEEFSLFELLTMIFG